jgi:Cu-Zn family superoxide dismutase
MTSLSEGNNPILDDDGAALVIHATADDYKTDPAGNAGARIACGVITRG